ncbi:olfactory receptor 6C4-like [Alexandromys fortis]|uniref:olfactory receptor 6C4-like n=1 Tax=Alexandromys fortis TaxID=100897 RepID=UPI0021534F75|nr:olfactory receptor 6C4-like [Microtus fortis]
MDMLITEETRNGTAIQEFILEGFPAVDHLGILLFLVHLLAYLSCFMGNMLIIAISCEDHRLHTPMYFFLSTFSIVEFCCISTVIPQLLAIFLSGRQRISFGACFTQAFVFLFLGSTAFFLLAVLSLDRYLAICKPLHYHTIMSPRVCVFLVTVCLVLGFLLVAIPIVKLSRSFYCGPNVIPHFFCDFGPLANLSCSETRAIKMLFFNFALIVLFTSFLIAVFAYSNIVVTIVRLPSARERQRAFSTCSSHLIVLLLMFGSCMFIYIKPKQSSRLDTNREAALVNTVVTPLLNPVIYTLRNKQVHQALKDAMSKVKLHRYHRKKYILSLT